MDSLPIFEAKSSFFMVDVFSYKGKDSCRRVPHILPRSYFQTLLTAGVNCRFGMKGIAAAAHYDGRRNFIAMLRGRKR
jgi:hypothetical protein